MSDKIWEAVTRILINDAIESTETNEVTGDKYPVISLVHNPDGSLEVKDVASKSRHGVEQVAIKAYTEFTKDLKRRVDAGEINLEELLGAKMAMPIDTFTERNGEKFKLPVLLSLTFSSEFERHDESESSDETSNLH